MPGNRASEAADDRAGHDHAHAHGGHDHSHTPKSFGFAFALGAGLNTAFVAAEAVFGILSNSTALLADAAHNLSDVLGLLIAWAAAGLSRRAPTARYTYGWRSSSILAALFNALFLLVAVGGIAWEAIQRFSRPEPVAEWTVIVVALIGIFINGFTAWLFASGRKDDINIEGAFLHMAADAAVSAGVVAAALVIVFTKALWIDPAVSLVICGVIVWSTWRLLNNSVRMSLSAVPGSIDPGEVRKFIEQLPGIASIHDLHVWPISTTETALTCHLVMPAGHPGDMFLIRTAQELARRFAIGHTTLQIEVSRNAACALEPDSVV
ncbi:MAG: cation diffusion facilitator family transporter [Xanthobacteraceae bacterium]|nr:cation diffusion facilitator family transporter [Xanthobacteraceae bacterium]